MLFSRFSCSFKLIVVNNQILTTMLYFNKVTLAEIDGTKVEAAIRKFAARRHASLDLQSSATEIGTEKLFLGLENEKSIQVTRLRSTFERFLPKLIIRFDKAKGFSEYRIRFSLLSNIVIAFIVIAVVLNVIYSFNNRQIDSDLASVVVYFFLFLLLTLVELRFTKAKLKSAIIKTTHASS